MTHLTPDELIDAMEGMLAPDRQAHLAACEACRRELADLSSVLGEAKQVSVPEPSPMFWEQFSARLNQAIDAGAAPASAWPSWLRWQVLLPMGALAMVVLALAMNIRPVSTVPDAIVETSALDVPLATDSWVVVASLVGDMDFDTAAAAGVVIEPGDAEQAVLTLTPEEQQELTRLLQAELTRAKS